METAKDFVNGIIWYSHHVLDNVAFVLLVVITVVFGEKTAGKKALNMNQNNW